MSRRRVAIICIGIIICVSECLAASNVSIEFINEDNPYNPRSHRIKRKTLGIEVQVTQCGEIGSDCGVWRNNEKPSKIIVDPCCSVLVCLGTGPFEQLNRRGEAHHSDKDWIIGMCSLPVDNDASKNAKDAYEQYLKDQP